jgi:hypothetical protein
MGTFLATEGFFHVSSLQLPSPVTFGHPSLTVVSLTGSATNGALN